MVDIVALGESLIDFTPSGKNDSGVPLYAQNPGGAPANVLAMASRLGSRTAFIGKVGNDAFGSYLRATMEHAGIDCTGLVMDGKYPTSLAFVTLDERGDRSFSFYRDHGADGMLSAEEVNIDVLRESRVFHFGSVSMTEEPARSATMTAARKAKEFGILVSYDPNYRPLLWREKDEAICVMNSVLPLCDIVKVSEEELALLSGSSDILEGSRILIEMGLIMVVVTMGPKGAFLRQGTYTKYFRTFDVETIDTTGAGDAFWGAFLWKILEGQRCITREQLAGLSTRMLDKAMVFANAAGSLATRMSGAIPSMPSLHEINECIKHTRLL